MYINLNNIILTGIPRSGTTLVCFLLNKLDNVLALDEPISVNDILKQKKDEEKVKIINQYYSRTRELIRTKGIAISKNINGKIFSNKFRERRFKGLRIMLSKRDMIIINNRLSNEGMLIIKHSALFTALLAEIKNVLLTYAIVRNPLSVLASWNSVRFPLQKGQSPVAEGLDRKLKLNLKKINDISEKQIFILNWFFRKYHSNLNAGRIIKYEEIISSGGKVLEVIDQRAVQLNESLENKNWNKIYDYKLMKKLGERLLKEDNAYWLQYYSTKDITDILEKLY